jgi:competence ComEA-like helix-hairpin-helix protein
VLLTLAPLGMLSFGAFVYAGVRAREKRWIVAGAVYAFVIYAGFLLATTDEDGVLSDVGVTLVLLAWAASFAHALAIRGAFLERMELVEGERYDHAEDRALEREEARRLAREEPAMALEMGVGRPDRDGFAGGLVDLNNAPASAIEELAGVSRELAERIVVAREEVGGFSSLEDLAQVVELPVRLVDRIRADVVVLPRGTHG